MTSLFLDVERCRRDWRRLSEDWNPAQFFAFFSTGNEYLRTFVSPMLLPVMFRIEGTIRTSAPLLVARNNFFNFLEESGGSAAECAEPPESREYT